MQGLPQTDWPEEHQPVGDVRLHDLEDRRVSLAQWGGQTLVLVGGGKGAMEPAIRWGIRLSRELGELHDVIVSPVAFIHPEPNRLVREVLRRAMRRLSPVEPLVDWNGSAARGLGLSRSDLAHVWLIDRASVLRYRVVGSCSDQAAAWVRERVSGLAATSSL